MTRYARQMRKAGWPGTVVLAVVLGLAAARAQPPSAPSILLGFTDPTVPGLWSMTSDPTGAVAVCHRAGDGQREKHDDCRHGTQSAETYRRIQSLTADAGLLQRARRAPVPKGGATFDIVILQYDAMRFDRSQINTDPVLKQLADLMTQTARRIGGEEFVPPL